MELKKVLSFLAHSECGVGREMESGHWSLGGISGEFEKERKEKRRKCNEASLETRVSSFSRSHGGVYEVIGVWVFRPFRISDRVSRARSSVQK